MLANAGVNVAEVAEVFLAKDVFDAGDFGTDSSSPWEHSGSSAEASRSVGSSSGSGRAAGMRSRSRSWHSDSLVAGGSSARWLAGAFAIVSGIGKGISVVLNALFVQRGARDLLRGRAFSLIMSTSCAVLGVGMVGAGALTNELGAQAAWEIAATSCAVGTGVGFVLLRGAHQGGVDVSRGGRAPLREHA
jgi:hypothetical protein